MTMKYILLSLLAFYSICGSGQTKHLTVEPNHSTIGFDVIIAGGATKVTGKFMEFDLKLQLVDGDWTRSSVEFIIQATSITTGIPDRDNHLRSSDFFDVETYPEISFVTSSIEETGENAYTMAGTFTMHRTSKEVSLPFSVVYEKGNTYGIHLEHVLNRVEYGVGADWQHSAMENFLSEEIPVTIDLWTRRDKRVED